MISQYLLIFTKDSFTLWTAFLFWGGYKGVVWSVLLSMISKISKKENRGITYGFFGISSSLVALFSAFVGGIIWEKFGAETMFIAGFCFSFFILLFLLVYSRLGQRKKVSYSG
jgi:predicted MFS family arabinose efflux permease